MQAQTIKTDVINLLECFIICYETKNNFYQVGSLKGMKNMKKNEKYVFRQSYFSQDSLGQLNTVIYYLDETGFHAEGAHIPLPNAIPSIRATTHSLLGFSDLQS